MDKSRWLDVAGNEDRIERVKRIIRKCASVGKMHKLCIESRTSRPTLYRWLHDQSDYVDIVILERIEENGDRILREVIEELRID